MLRVVAYYLAGIAAPGVLLVGVWGMLSACLVYAADYGWQGGMAAGGVVFLVCVALAGGCLWLNRRLGAALRSVEGPPLPARVFCQRCGTPACPQEVACSVCGATVFGGGRPSTND